MSEFYRFLRPIEFDYQRSVIETMPTGGICLFVRYHGELKVSYSICPPEQLFNRTVARRLAKRAVQHTVESTSVSAASIIHALLSQPGHEELRNQVAIMQTKADQAFAISAHHKEAIEALQLRKRYDELNSEVQGRSDPR